MGLVGNALLNAASGTYKITTGVGQGVAAGACAIMGQRGLMLMLAREASGKIDEGSKACPIIGECRDLIEGVVNGDLKKAAMNAGVLALMGAPVDTRKGGYMKA